MRKEKTITLTDRGNERKFRIREMSATQLESWTMRALLQFSAVLDLDPADGFNMEKIAGRLMANGLSKLSQIDYDKAKPLLDELLACCYRTDGGIEQQCTPEAVDGFIEEMKTLLQLRMEVLKLNFDFFTTDEKSASPDSNPIINIPKPSAS